MAASSRTRSGGFSRPLSASDRGQHSHAFAIPSAASFLNRRAESPHPINLIGSPRGRPVDSLATKRGLINAAPQRKTCMCSPTTHPGSFRCGLHKGLSPHRSVSSPSNRLNARRSAMTNSLVRIGTVEGELVKRALAALIRPSSHQQRRRAGFQPRPSRLSVMSKVDDL